MHALSPPTVIEVSWIISKPYDSIEVREGEGLRIELFAQAFGLYATPIEIGVQCDGHLIDGAPQGATLFQTLHSRACNCLPLFILLFAAYCDRDYVVLSGSILEFTDVGSLRSNSSNRVVLSIINDDIAE